MNHEINHSMSSFDAIVIGSGAAGLGVALTLPRHWRIALVCKDPLSTAASAYAQGGIAAVMDQTADNLESHMNDTVLAGVGLCDVDVVRQVVANGKAAILWLQQQGVEFSYKDNRLHLNREGGHSQRRIVHVADRTGSVVIQSLGAQVKQRSNIVLCESHMAIDLIIEDDVCCGVKVLDLAYRQRRDFYAPAIVIATGGASSIYRVSTQPTVGSGDGIAMAWRAGAVIENMEFNQFHPTAFYAPTAPPFLITEAVRGEGAYLLNKDLQRFMPHYDDRLELAPRDIVARAVHSEMSKDATEYVWLDLRHFDKELIYAHFPSIYQHCVDLGIDIFSQLLPVVPAAHYTCGGIKATVEGKTNVLGLYAIGEVSCTGLHGANRMASNSLLECFVGAAQLSQLLQRNTRDVGCMTVRNKGAPIPVPDAVVLKDVDINRLMRQLQDLMSGHVGIIRSNASLAYAKNELSLIQEQYRQHAQGAAYSRRGLELRNLITVAQLVIVSAEQRDESRGLHFNQDFPRQNDKARTTCLVVTKSMSNSESPLDLI